MLFGFFWGCFQGSHLHWVFVPLLGALRFWVFLWGPFPLLLLFSKKFWTMMFSTLMPYLGWDFHSLFHIKVLLFSSFFPPTPRFSMLTSLLLFNPYSHIWEIFRDRFFGMSKGSPNSSANLFAHLQRWGRFCFYGAYQFDSVFRDFCRWLSFLLGVTGANSLGPLPFQAHLRWGRDLLLVVAQASIPPF